MTTQELHNSLNILVQKSSTHWNRSFLPQEYDFFINREISKYIKQRLSPLSNNKQQGIFDIKKRIQDLNPLLTTRVINVLQFDNKDLVVPLPKDYLFYISASSYVSCENNESSEIIRNISFNPFENFDNIDTLEISATLPVLGTVALFSLDDLPDGYLPQDNIPTYKKNFIFNNAVVQIIKKRLRELQFVDTTVSFYNNININNNVITEVSYNTFNNKIELIGNLTDLTVLVNDEIYEIDSAAFTYNINTIPDTKVKEGEVRVIDEEYKTDVLNSYLSRSVDASVCAVLREFFIEIPKPAGVRVHAVKLTYLRKPVIVDLLLNSSSELNNTILEEVISNTAQTILGVVGSDDYEKYVRENIIIE